jgi:hypothetical protein
MVLLVGMAGAVVAVFVGMGHVLMLVNHVRMAG